MTDNEIIKAYVDKEALINALNNDKKAVYKGYADGIKDFAKFLIDTSKDGFVNICDIVDCAASMQERTKK